MILSALLRVKGASFMASCYSKICAKYSVLFSSLYTEMILH